jgi:hypothetical protein
MHVASSEVGSENSLHILEPTGKTANVVISRFCVGFSS